MVPKVLIYSCMIICLARVRGDAPVASYLPPNSGGGGGGHTGGGFGGSSGGYGVSGGGRDGFGGSDGGEEEGKPEPFSFSYEVKDQESGNDYSHRAESDGNTVRGEYNVLLPDGRIQKVTYTADSQGYNAEVQYKGEANVGAGGGSYSMGGQGFGGGGGYSTGGQGSGGEGGYPSGGPSGGGYPSGGGFPSEGSGTGGYPSGGGGFSGGEQGYPSGRPNSNYLPPGK